MATVQKNLGLILNPQNFVRVTITPEGGSDSYVINNIIEGNAACTQGLREALDPDVNEGELLDDVRSGNKTHSMFTMACKATAESDAGSLIDLLSEEGAGGIMPRFTVLVEKFFGQDEENGQSWTNTHMVRADPNFTITPGQNHDTFNFSMKSPRPWTIVDIRPA